VVETNVALIVGSTPAVAAFLRTYVSESAFMKSLWARIRGTKSEYSGKDSKPSQTVRIPRLLATFGSSNVQRPRAGTYELTDAAVAAAQGFADEGNLLSNVPTAEHKQLYAQPNSTERLV
jgi:hypothetical protein